MDADKLNEFVDQSRWLLNNGLAHDAAKNQLFFFGSIAHPSVQAVEMQMHLDQKKVDYILYFTKDVLKKVDKYKKLSTSTSIWGMWRFKRFLQKEGDLNLQGILSTFVKGYCGPAWNVELTLIDFDAYLDTSGEDQSEPDRESQQPNKLLD